MDFVLGVDGGATKTLVRIADITGKNITEVRSGPTNYKDIGIEKVIMNLNNGIIKAVEKIRIDTIIFKSACFGMAGLDDEFDYEIYKKIIFNNEIGKFLNYKKTIICIDGKIALNAGSNNKNRIIINCGTGLTCCGINEMGKEARTSGWDYLLGDEGSGYAVGMDCIKTCIRTFDGRGEKTLLSSSILEKLNLKDEWDLARWVYKKPFSKKKIADLARVVERTAENGDKKSIEIYENNAKEVITAVLTVVKILNIENEFFDLVMSGGLFKCKKYFKDIIVGMLSKKFPKAKFIELEKNPVEGAIKMAVENL